jgi:hypothetical protein
MALFTPLINRKLAWGASKKSRPMVSFLPSTSNFKLTRASAFFTQRSKVNSSINGRSALQSALPK